MKTPRRVFQYGRKTFQNEITLPKRWRHNFFKHKSSMIGDCWGFKFLQRSVTRRHFFKNSSPREKIAKLSSFWDCISYLGLYQLLSRNIIFSPSLTTVARAKKKKILANRFAHAISVHYRDFEHSYVYWIWLRGSTSYVINRAIAGRFVELAKSVICHVFMHCLGLNLLQDVLKYPSICFRGKKNMAFTVNMLVNLHWRRVRLFDQNCLQDEATIRTMERVVAAMWRSNLSHSVSRLFWKWYLAVTLQSTSELYSSVCQKSEKEKKLFS